MTAMHHSACESLCLFSAMHNMVLGFAVWYWICLCMPQIGLGFRRSQCCDIVRDDVIVHIQCKICLERKKIP